MVGHVLPVQENLACSLSLFSLIFSLSLSVYDFLYILERENKQRNVNKKRCQTTKIRGSISVSVKQQTRFEVNLSCSWVRNAAHVDRKSKEPLLLQWQWRAYQRDIQLPFRWALGWPLKRVAIELIIELNAQLSWLEPLPSWAVNGMTFTLLGILHWGTLYRNEFMKSMKLVIPLHLISWKKAGFSISAGCAF